MACLSFKNIRAIAVRIPANTLGKYTKTLLYGKQMRRVPKQTPTAKQTWNLTALWTSHEPGLCAANGKKCRLKIEDSTNKR